jgi:hypothetical protein
VDAETEPRSVSSEAFDDLFAEGRSAVSAGRHRIQTPPVEGGHRWGLSALLRWIGWRTKRRPRPAVTNG